MLHFILINFILQFIELYVNDVIVTNEYESYDTGTNKIVKIYFK